MSIYQKGRNGVVSLNRQPFSTELELETALVETPNLVAEPDGHQLAFVARQVILGSAGVLDVLLVDSEGTPVAVEVKLGRNAESRREVVGQVVDYVSTLTLMTVDELDRAVGGALETALKSFDVAGLDTFERLWTNVGTNLRAGFARYIIAIDAPPPDLQRIVGFLAARSSLRVSVVAIDKYVDPSGHLLFVPHHAASAVTNSALSVPFRKPVSSELQAVLDAYENLAAPGFSTAGAASNYRQIRPGGWPAGLHYEFIRRRDSVGVEIHLESKTAQLLSDLVKGFSVRQNTLPFRLEWDAAWTYGPRLYVTFPTTESPQRTAMAMKQLIDLTYAEITTALQAA